MEKMERCRCYGWNANCARGGCCFSYNGIDETYPTNSGTYFSLYREEKIAGIKYIDDYTISYVCRRKTREYKKSKWVKIQYDSFETAMKQIIREEDDKSRRVKKIRRPRTERLERKD